MSISFAIHPAIGVARIGNCPLDLNDPDSFHLTPEAPGELPNDGKPYKSGGRIKKQGQRFRIYEYKGGKPKRAVTLADNDIDQIVWSVQLVNAKAALLKKSKILGHVVSYSPAGDRNKSVTDRQGLVIDSGVQQVGGQGQPSVRQLGDSIKFPFGNRTVSKTVNLGTITTETDTGNLLVFGSDGLSEGLDQSGRFSATAPAPGDYDNDRWYDSVSDGIVQAAIHFKDGRKLTLTDAEQQARVIVGVPSYAPAILAFASLYDVALDAFGFDPAQLPTPRFSTDIYPILASAVMAGWTSLIAAAGHHEAKPGNYLRPSILALVNDNSKDASSAAFQFRDNVFKRVRPPDGSNPPGANMPMLAGGPTVTALQYEKLWRWRQGDFIADGPPVVMPFGKIPVADQPDALDRAGLETTCALAFHPGMEAWKLVQEPWLYRAPPRRAPPRRAPLRIRTDLPAGYLTIGMALPWQVDFKACQDNWWPSHRPQEVFEQLGQPPKIELGVPWVPEQNFNMMTDWPKLGFVVKQGKHYLNTERGA